MRYHAGQQTDALIAEKVMGLEPWPGLKGAFKPPDRSPTPMAPQPYTTEMNAAWQIVEKLVADGYEVALVSTAGPHRAKGLWTCAVASGNRGAKAHADTAALAIYRAALALV